MKIQCLALIGSGILGAFGPLSVAIANSAPVVESITASYVALNNNQALSTAPMQITLNNINRSTNSNGCQGNALQLPISSPQLHIAASDAQTNQQNSASVDINNVCMQQGLTTFNYLIPGLTSEQPLQTPNNLMSDQQIAYRFFTFNSPSRHLTANTYQKLDSQAQQRCQQWLKNSKPRALSGNCYAIPMYNSNQNAGYYAVAVKMSNATPSA